MKVTETNKWIITAAVMTGTLMSVLDASIVNVALPYMRGNLGASIEEITWVITGYILATVIMMPLASLLSSRFGRKRFYMFSVFLFTLSSILCGISWNMSSLVTFRVIQGIGGGSLIPLSLAIIRETFPREEQGTAMGIYGLGVVLGPAFGPTLGGWLINHYSWPWIFYINIPVGIISLLMVRRFIQDPPYLKREKGKIDFVGLGLLILALGALQIMLAKGRQNSWFASDFIKYLAAISLTGLLLFIWRELTTDKPAVNLRILKDINFASGTLIGGILGIGLYGSLFLLPMFLQLLMGYSALSSGIALIPRSIAMAITMPLAGRIYNRAGPRLLIGLGLIISAISFWEFSRLSLNVGLWGLFFPQFWQGVGFGLIFIALTTASLSTIKKSEMTAATGLYGVVRQLFGSIGIAIVATQLTGGGNRYRAILAGNITNFRDVTSKWLNMFTGAMLNKGADPATAHHRALRLLDGEVIKQAAMLAYNHIFFLITVLFTVSIPLIFLLKTGREFVNKTS